MTLRFKDHGEPVKRLQRNLNKLGSILLVDGDFGPGTRDAVLDARTALSITPSASAGAARAPAGADAVDPADADDALQAALAAFPDPFPALTAAGVTFIARLEVGSPRQYRLLYRHPEWPGESSGITIGIGYDLKFVRRAEFEADWPAVPAAVVNQLVPVFGVTGSESLRATVADLDFPLEMAMKVFIGRTLPEFLRKTRAIYPQVAALPPARAASLVSLVYNRGADLEGDRRREMREIQRLLAAGNLDNVPDQIEAMVRLWDPRSGLVSRRHDEARLWRSGFAALQLD